MSLSIYKTHLVSIPGIKFLSNIKSAWHRKRYQKPGLLEVNFSIVGHLKQTRFLCFFIPILPDLISGVICKN